MSLYSSSDSPWFRLGRLEVTTTVLTVLIGAVSLLAWVIVPSLPQALYLSPAALFAGQAWRLATWPLAEGLSLWSLLTLLMLWYFGGDLERQIGRRRMAGLLIGIWAALTAAAVLVGLVLPQGTALAGLGPIQFVVLLLWIAEYPRRPFFFGVPAWVVGLVLVALQALGMVGARNWGGLLSLLLGLAISAVVARRQGLLADYAQIPGRRTAPRPQAVRTPQPTRAQAREDRRRVSDRERLDELLDRINAGGLDSLTESERSELLAIRARLRGNR